MDEEPVLKTQVGGGGGDLSLMDEEPVLKTQVGGGGGPQSDE